MANYSKLPERPNLDHLRRQAKDLRKAIRQGDTSALERVGNATANEHHVDPENVRQGAFSILDAQRTIAREYGFPSWAAMKREVERRTLSFEEKVKQFVQAACQERLGRAKQLLEDDPGIARATFQTALVLGDAEAVPSALDKDPELVKSVNGPRDGWYPLHYVSISGFHTESEAYADGLEATVRILIDSGADPNAAFIHPTWPDCPLAPLYHATGRSNNTRVAQVLIEAGAELDDGESIYHAAEKFHLKSLELMCDAGADVGRKNHPTYGNTPLYFILGYRNAHHSAETANKGARWLLENGADPNIQVRDGGETPLHVAIRLMRERVVVEMLLTHGADPNVSRKDGKTPYDLSIRNGDAEAMSVLERHGAKHRPLTERERFLRACMSGDGETARNIKASNLAILDELDGEERYLLVEAATENKVDAVKLMLDLGFDIAFKGTKGWGATALHWAAWHGQTETCRLLLRRQAPIDAKANPPEASLPLGWAIHGSSNCMNPRGDYPAIVEAIILAGAEPKAHQLGMASEAVGQVIERYLPEEEPSFSRE